MKNSHCLRKKSAHKLTRSRNAPLTRVDRLDRVNRKICRSRNRAPDYADQHTLHKRVSNFIRWLLSVAIFIPIKFPILLNSQLYSITISANSRETHERKCNVRFDLQTKLYDIDSPSPCLSVGELFARVSLCNDLVPFRLLLSVVRLVSVLDLRVCSRLELQLLTSQRATNAEQPRAVKRRLSSKHTIILPLSDIGANGIRFLARLETRHLYSDGLSRELCCNRDATRRLH